MDVYVVIPRSGLEPRDLETACGGVSLIYTWSEWDHGARAAAEIELAQRAGKRVYLRILGGAWSPDSVLRAVPTRVTREPNERRPGKPVIVPVVWSRPYLTRWLRFVSQAQQQVPAPAVVAVTGVNRWSAEMYLSEVLALERDCTVPVLLAAWKKCITAWGAWGLPRLALNVSASVGKMSEQLVPELAGLVHYTGNNVLLGDPAQVRTGQAWLPLEHRGTRGLAFQRAMSGAGSDRMARRENLAGILSFCSDVGAEVLEVGVQDARENPDMIEAAQK